MYTFIRLFNPSGIFNILEISNITCRNMKKLCILQTHCIYVFLVNLEIITDYLSKEH